MSVETLNSASKNDAHTMLTRCCGATRWVDDMVQARPFADKATLHQVADTVWATMDRADILEAFDHHPRIGADLNQLRAKFASTAIWSGNEQSGIETADEAVLHRLRDGNIAYEDHFGHIFIVCATGKSAAEMLALLEARMDNSPDDELRIAAGEQAKITHLRLEKL